MKDELREIVRGRDANAARNLAREYLQAQILASLQRQGAMVPLAFQGGTALRFLYSIGRYSEDLDFSLEKPRPAFTIAGLAEGVAAGLRRQGYLVETARIREAGPVWSAFVCLPGLPYDLGLSAQRAEILAVKLEVDARPPAGATLATTLVRRHVLLHLHHHDQASLLAGKLHAVLVRPYPKGRDWYDLLFYLSDRSWPAPNLVLLNNALRQTGWTEEPLTAGSWPAAVLGRLRGIDWEKLVTDVRPFLENPAEAAMLTREAFRGLLEGRTGRTRR